MAGLSPFPGTSVPPFWSGGPSPSGYYNFPAKAAPATNRPTTHSQYPITTGTSVFSIKYKDGVIFAADSMGSDGSLARFPDVKRVMVVNDTTLIGYSGDLADFQYLKEQIERKQREEDARGGGITMKPKALHCWLTRYVSSLSYCNRIERIFVFIHCIHSYAYLYICVRTDTLTYSL